MQHAANNKSWWSGKNWEKYHLLTNVVLKVTYRTPEKDISRRGVQNGHFRVGVVKFLIFFSGITKMIRIMVLVGIKHTKLLT